MATIARCWDYRTFREICDELGSTGPHFVDQWGQWAAIAQDGTIVESHDLARVNDQLRACREAVGPGKVYPMRREIVDMLAELIAAAEGTSCDQTVVNAAREMYYSATVQPQIKVG